MRWDLEEGRHWRAFYQPPGIHDHRPIHGFGNQPKIMGYKYQRHTILALQLGQ